MELGDAHVVVTGGSRGIGLSIARVLVRRGARLTLVARNAEALQQAAAEVGGVALPADLADPEQLARVIPAAEEASGPVDVLINNAGLMVPGPLVKISASQLRGVLSTNLLAPLELARQAMVSMVPRRDGAIVNISSLAGELCLRNVIPYCSSKAGLNAATQALRRELRGTGVRAQLAMLGYVQTDMMDDSHADPVTGAQADRLGMLPSLTSESVAEGIVKGIERERKLIVLPPLAAPVHQLRLLPQRFVDVVMTGIPRSLP